MNENDEKALLRVETWQERRRLLYGDWIEETEQERKLRDLAKTYHVGCEAYDTRVCSGVSPRTREAMPLTPDEMRLINRHALKMREITIAEGACMGFTLQQVEEAIRQWVKRSDK